MMRQPICLFVLAGASVSLSACRPAGAAAPPAPAAAAPSAPPTAAATATPAANATPAAALVAARPYKIDVPPSYDAARPAPLLLLLHPFDTSSERFVRSIGAVDIAHERGFLLVSPDGLTDSDGKQFWNATDVCCDFHGKGVDDVAYLAAVIADVRGKYAVDPARIYALGYSNGGFMAQRLGCELPELAAVVDLVGASSSDAAACRPKGPLSVLKIHGDQDELVLYQGGKLGLQGPKGGVYPSARDGAAAWAARNGCSGATDTKAPPLDLAADIPGAETSIERWVGCRPGVDVELWTVRGAGHVFKFQKPALPRALIDFLVAHPRPGSRPQ